MSNLIGQSIGRYHILERLGEGGMAVVYKAYDTRLERDVAIKIIRREVFAPDQLDRMLKRFEREAKSLAKLSHPNIVGVIDFGEYEDSPYLVMEYLPGGTLKQRTGMPIPWQAAIPLLISIAQALEYAHEHNLIHRDIKPGNILLTEKGQPMLTDFGIAKILESEDTATLTGSGVGIGTPEYMAPEQWTGETTTQSDIYSLGVVFYEMITGRKPYSADTPAATLLMQATNPLPRPTLFAPDIPDSVEKVLLKALAKNLEDRYQTAAEFGIALEQLLKQGEKVSMQDQATVTDISAPLPVRIAKEEKKAADDLRTWEAIEPVPESPRKKRRGWVWAAGILAVVLCLCLPLGAGAYYLVVNGYVSSDSLTISTNPQTSASPTPTPLPTQPPLPTYTPYPTKKTAPTSALLSIDLPSILPQQWDGSYMVTGRGTVKISLIIDDLNGNKFTGRMLWLPTDIGRMKYNLIINRMNGEYLQDFGDAFEQGRWSPHPDFAKSDKSGTWLKWTETETISGNSVFTMNGWYYAHIRTDGTLVGIYYFNATETTPAKDSYELELAD